MGKREVCCSPSLLSFHASTPSISCSYLLSALSLLALHSPLVSDLIVEEGAEVGLYGVKYCTEGEWKTMVRCKKRK